MHYNTEENNGIHKISYISDFLHHPHKALEGTFYDIDLWSIWKKITCPVLVIHGLHSDLLTKGIIRKMQRTKENIQIYEVNDAGHAPALLEAVNHETINNWLNNFWV